MKQPFHPSLLRMDNEMEAFWQEHKRKIANQGRSIAEQQSSITVGDDLGRGPRSSAQIPKTRWADSHINAHFNETESDRQFIASAEKLRAAYPPKKRFSWAGLIALLVVAVIVGGLTWLFVANF